MKKLVQLRLTIQNINKTAMYVFWYDYVIAKHGEDAKICYIARNSLIPQIKANSININTAKDVETKFNT